ncbi:putative toxin-antitoxin system toxin component, PIN family [candidate division KSB1 bacterium]|nr:putative toxin-antitoxin system toxin component, PIN family [candidate division KSB1 bacterium]
MNEPRFVFDTNVIVSALLLKHSVSRQAFDRAHARGRLLLSEETLAELYEVLRREKFAKYVLETERLQFLAAFAQAAQQVEATERIQVCRDPQDNKFLELAVSGEAACLVTGDADLLALHPFRNIPILNPPAFLQF